MNGAVLENSVILVPFWFYGSACVLVLFIGIRVFSDGPVPIEYVMYMIKKLG